jgi:hypothetical protein
MATSVAFSGMNILIIISLFLDFPWFTACIDCVRKVNEGNGDYIS